MRMKKKGNNRIIRILFIKHYNHFRIWKIIAAFRLPHLIFLVGIRLKNLFWHPRTHTVKKSYFPKHSTIFFCIHRKGFLCSLYQNRFLVFLVNYWNIFPKLCSQSGCVCVYLFVPAHSDYWLLTIAFLFACTFHIAKHGSYIASIRFPK